MVASSVLRGGRARTGLKPVKRPSGPRQRSKAGIAKQLAQREDFHTALETAVKDYIEGRLGSKATAQKVAVSLGVSKRTFQNYVAHFKKHGEVPFKRSGKPPVFSLRELAPVAELILDRALPGTR